MNWFFHKIYWTGWISAHNKRRRSLTNGPDAGRRALLGLALLGFTAVYREGFEVVLFLQNLRITAGSRAVLEGVALGLALTVAVGVVTFSLAAAASVQAHARRDGRAARVRAARHGRREHPGDAARGLAARALDRGRLPRFRGSLVRRLPDRRGHPRPTLCGRAACSARTSSPSTCACSGPAHAPSRRARRSSKRSPSTTEPTGGAPPSRSRSCAGELAPMRRGELDSRLLILVTLALVAFGLVMVYSATSAAAAVGGRNPMYYLERQGIYGALGIVLMILAQRGTTGGSSHSRRCSSSCRSSCSWPSSSSGRRSTVRAAGSRSGPPSSSRPSWPSSRSRSGLRRISRAGRRRAPSSSCGGRSAR